MVLDGVSTWKIQSPNVVYRKGYLGDMTVTLRNGEEAELQGYGLYVQDNVYFGNAIVQLDPLTLADIEDELSNYTVDFSGYVDVITVDDVGNCIGGLFTLSGNNNENISYRIHSAITVRKSGTLLTLAANNADAGTGTYKIYAEGHGCAFFIENSTIYITAIDNIKDGLAGSSDDTNFDYAAMRNMESCYVDLIIECEGKGSIQKKFPITIKHDSQPFVGADISNEFSAVSWNTKTQAYIGLPIVLDMKMWHNNEILDIASVDDISLSCATTGVTLVNGTAPSSPAASSIYYSKSIITVDGHKYARISLNTLGINLPNVIDIDVTCNATYSGVSYERTLRHTINKSTDTNVYSLLPSEDEVIYNKNRNSLSANTVDCSVICDSSDNKHYTVAFADFATHKIVLYYKKFYTDGTSDSSETVYNNSAISIDSSVKEVRFYLYGLTNGSVDRTILHDTEGVPVLADGQDGKGVEYIFYAVADWDHEDSHMPTIYDVAADRQVDDYCPYTDAQHSGQWTDEPTGVSLNYKFEFYAQRKKVNGVWQAFGNVKLWDHYATDGVSPYMIDLSNEQSFINCDETGAVLTGATYETSKLMLFKGTTYAFTDFNITITPTNISCNGSSSAFTLTDAQKTTAQSNGYFTLTPSAITANSAQIVVTCTLRTNTSIVLTAVYKINKNVGGQNGVIYSLMPYLDVVHKDGDGNFIDTTLSVDVKKVVGTTASIINTSTGLSNAGLTLVYTQGTSNTENSLGLSNNSISTLFGTASYITIILKSGSTIVDKERINVVSDGGDSVVYQVIVKSSSAVVNSAGNLTTSFSCYVIKNKGGETTDHISTGACYARFSHITNRTALTVDSNYNYSEVSSFTGLYSGLGSPASIIIEYVLDNVVRAFATIPITVNGAKGDPGNNGLTGCHERVFEIAQNSDFDNTRMYVNEENTVKDGIRYVDFLAVVDSTQASGYSVYMCKTTHQALSSLALDLAGQNYWTNVSTSVAHFFHYLIAKNANINILTGAQFIIAESNGNVVAGLANNTYPLWLGHSTPASAPFRVNRAGKVWATDGVFSGVITTKVAYQAYQTITTTQTLDISNGSYVLVDENLTLYIPAATTAANVTLTLVFAVNASTRTAINPPTISGSFYCRKTHNSSYRMTSFMLPPNQVVKLHSIGGDWFIDTVDEDAIEI